jgi:hypothetical protein
MRDGVVRVEHRGWTGVQKVTELPNDVLESGHSPVVMKNCGTRGGEGRGTATSQRPSVVSPSAATADRGLVSLHLRAVGVRARVGHGQVAGAAVLDLPRRHTTPHVDERIQKVDPRHNLTLKFSSLKRLP